MPFRSTRTEKTGSLLHQPFDMPPSMVRNAQLAEQASFAHPGDTKELTLSNAKRQQAARTPQYLPHHKGRPLQRPAIWSADGLPPLSSRSAQLPPMTKRAACCTNLSTCLRPLFAMPNRPSKQALLIPVTPKNSRYRTQSGSKLHALQNCLLEQRWFREHWPDFLVRHMAYFFRSKSIHHTKLIVKMILSPKSRTASG